MGNGQLLVIEAKKSGIELATVSDEQGLFSKNGPIFRRVRNIGVIH